MRGAPQLGFSATIRKIRARTSLLTPFRPPTRRNLEIHETLLHASSRQDERLPPPRPERSQRDPEQLVQGSQSSARPLRVQSEQLPTESQVFKDELLVGAKRADDPPEEMPERHNHGKNTIGTIRIQLCAKSVILQMYDLLARHRCRHRAGHCLLLSYDGFGSLGDLGCRDFHSFFQAKSVHYLTIHLEFLVLRDLERLVLWRPPNPQPRALRRCLLTGMPQTPMM